MKIKQLTDNDYVVLLKKGDNLITALTNFHNQVDNKFCKINAIGAVTDISLGYAYLEDNEIKYNNIEYKEEYELLSLDGNMSLRDNKTAIHLHASLSDKNNNCIGGHVNYATISIVCEMFITVYNTKISREFDKEVGIAVLDI
ncbi:MAG: PPC domain-containing DNA-binding protein [bacterium]